MVWDASRSTLYAATACPYVDRFGRRHNYRRFEKPDYVTGADQNSETGSVNGDAAHVSLATAQDETGNEDMDMDTDEDSNDSVDDEYDLMTTRRWPKRAYHAENYFGYAFDSGKHAVCM